MLRHTAIPPSLTLPTALEHPADKGSLRLWMIYCQALATAQNDLSPGALYRSERSIAWHPLLRGTAYCQALAIFGYARHLDATKSAPPCYGEQDLVKHSPARLGRYHRDDSLVLPDNLFQHMVV